MTLRRLGLAIGTLILIAAARPPQATFRAGVELVRLDLLAVRDGRPVVGLTRDDFEVLDNGVRQGIEHVSFEEVPIDVRLVIDGSRSVAGEKLGHLREAGGAFLLGLRPGDRAALITFAEQVRLAAATTDRLWTVQAALEGLRGTGSTSMFDALYSALMLPARPDARLLVLLFSDGLDNTSWLSQEDLLQVVRESDAVIYSVGVRRGGTPAPLPNDALLDRLAEQTGGRLFHADSSRRLPEIFARIVEEMTARYLLTFYPSGVEREGWHDLRIRLRNGRGDIIARRGYYVVPAAGRTR